MNDYGGITMEKLQYDSFYKFLVSLGIILITIPIFSLLYLLNMDFLLISQYEFDNLSIYSQNQIFEKEYLLNNVQKCLPLFFVTLLLVGITLIIFGAIKWYTIQKELDDQIKSDTITKKINAKKMSTSEVAAKAIKEVTDAVSSDTNDHNKITLFENKIIKYIDIEDKCYSYAHSKYSREYQLKRNIRVGDYQYDFIGVSKHNNIDLIFEVKYWKTIPSKSTINKILFTLTKSGENYETIAHRNFNIKLMIIAPKQELEKKHFILNEFNNKVDIQCIPEEDLK